MNLKTKILAYLELVRFPNLFTAMADVSAGYLIVQGSAINWGDLGFLVLATSCIYAAGCALNDYRDRRIDAQERPGRPIPSKRVSVPEALVLTGALFVGGFLSALNVNGYSFAVIALILIGFVLVYDLVFKEREIAGPAVMAACRSLNLMLGMGSGLVLWSLLPVFPLISFIYVFSMTSLSQFEVKDGLRGKRVQVFGGLALSMLSVAFLVVYKQLETGAWIFLVCLLLFSGPRALIAGLKPEPHKVGMAVKYLILGIPLLDAAYVAGTHHWAYGIPVALCIVPSMGLSRFFYVT